MNNRYDNGGFDSGWIFPVIMTAVFWPVGVVMLLKQYKRSCARKQKAQSYNSMFTGSALLALAGIVLLMDEASVLGFFMLLGGISMGAYCAWQKRRNSRLRIYESIIGTRRYVKIDEIADTTGRNRAIVKADLQHMIDTGMLPYNAYIDHARELIITDPTVAPYLPKAEPVVAEPVHEAPHAKKYAETAHTEEKAAPADPEQKKADVMEETFNAKLREIRYLNDMIDDPDVSARIDSIEHATAGIFTLIKEKPDRIEEIHSFMNYYLPATFKLLNAYAKLEKQDVDVQTIQNSKREIEAVLDKLVEGFNTQYSRLLEADAVDISSDIKVLETMMAKDGLTDNGQTMGLHL